MKIDIFDTTVPDYSILDKKSLMESLGYESETSLRNAVDSGFIPPSMDYGGRNGAGRWTVGMIRKWFTLKGEKAVLDALRHLNYVSKKSISQKSLPRLAVGQSVGQNNSTDYPKMPCDTAHRDFRF